MSVEEIALRLANEWLRLPPDEREKIPEPIGLMLAQLHRKTLGDERRCFCCDGKRGTHDMRCPARRPTWLG